MFKSKMHIWLCVDVDQYTQPSLLQFSYKIVHWIEFYVDTLFMIFIFTFIYKFMLNIFNVVKCFYSVELYRSLDRSFWWKENFTIIKMIFTSIYILLCIFKKKIFKQVQKDFKWSSRWEGLMWENLRNQDKW